MKQKRTTPIKTEFLRIKYTIVQIKIKPLDTRQNEKKIMPEQTL